MECLSRRKYGVTEDLGTVTDHAKLMRLQGENSALKDFIGLRDRAQELLNNS